MSGRNNRDTGRGGQGAEAWLLPYADMITLLLGLFIVLFAMSSLDVAKFDSVSRALSQTFKGNLLEQPGGITPGANGVLNPEAASAVQSPTVINTGAAQSATKKRFEREQKTLEEMAKTADGALKNQLSIRSSSRGLVISVAGDALFESGSSTIKEPALQRLKSLAVHLRDFGADLEIEGHTDGVPNGGPAGNFALSGQRAQAVLALFMNQGMPGEKMIAIGRGEFKPLVKPAAPTADTPRNRRVEIHLLAPGAKNGPLTKDDKSPQKRATDTNTSVPTNIDPIAHIVEPIVTVTGE